MNTFGARLRDARKSRGNNQDEFAALAGVSRNAQVNYETDKRMPDAGYLLALARAGVDVVQLVTATPLAAMRKLATIREIAQMLSKMGIPAEQGGALLDVLFGQSDGAAPAPASLPPDEADLLAYYRKAADAVKPAILAAAASLAAAAPHAPSPPTEKPPKPPKVQQNFHGKVGQAAAGNIINNGRKK